MTGRGVSLKVRLGLGALLLAAGSIAAAVILYTGMTRVADRLDTALGAEQRMARYSTLSTQISTFLVVATEAIQTQQPHDIRTQRLDAVSAKIFETFAALRADLESAVVKAEHLGIDQQARYGTQSLGIARMEALLNATTQGLRARTSDSGRLRAYIDGFASGFDPLLNASVNAEVLFRAEILKSIDDLRQTLSRTAIALASLSVLLVLAFYFGLIHPQFRRLDQLRAAAQQIGDENFDLSLPETRRDEIGQLFAETRQTARNLAQRKAEIQTEWARLHNTIEQRTQELRDANTRLETIDRNRRRFFADMSHELRTPLTVILMEAQLGQASESEPNKAFATIESRASRLNQRIDDLLRVARSDSGQLVLDPQTVALPEVVEDICAEVRAELELAKMELRCDRFPTVFVNTDANWFRQVVVGSIRNAVRHASTGGIVALRFAETREFAGIIVQDNGPGLPSEQHSHVFDRFAQHSEHAEGFGVGLALSRWVVSELKGELNLESPASQPLGDHPGLAISIRMPRVNP